MAVTIILLACLESDCPTMFFKTASGKCPGCGVPGYRVGWALRPPRYLPPDDDAVR